MSLSLPAPPASGIVTDRDGITWRADTSGCWNPDSCPTCGARLAGGLTWPQLLEQRGPLAPV